MRNDLKEGVRIKVVALKPDLDGKPDPAEHLYRNRIGRIRYIDSAGNIHCEWEDDLGSDLAILPDDTFIVLGE